MADEMHAGASVIEWKDILARVKALPLDRGTLLALAAAQRLVTRDSPSDTQLVEALETGWTSAGEGQAPQSSVAAQISDRPDLDDDFVAATFYALGALGGDPDSAYWAVSRSVDAAFARVPYPPCSTTFRPVDEDARHPEVQQELAWLAQTMDVIQRGRVTSETIARLRSSS